MTIAIIGLGRMGLPMATNLLESDRVVIGVDLDQTRREEFEQAGGRTESLETAANEADVAITVLRNRPQVLGVVDSLFPELSNGCLYMNMGTTGPETAEEIKSIADEYSIRVLDAPVSGGVDGAKEGSLAIMAGGEERDFEEAKPILEHMGDHIFHMGNTGAGQTAKLCNQLLVGAELLSISEAFHLGESADIDPEDLYDLLTSCIGTSGILEQKGDRLVDKNFEPEADVNLQNKDSQLTLQLANDSDVPAYLASTVAQVFKHAKRSGLGEKDHFAVYELIDE